MILYDSIQFDMIHSLWSKISKDSPLTSQPEKNLHQNVARWSAEAIMEVSGYRMVGGVVCEGRKNTRWGIYG